MSAPLPAGRVTAVLGPTNTGKTHLAMERMLGHRSGMIGFPLRLLARENYDRVVRQKGARAVALVTGEEKILPPHPQYWVCTVESMPLDRPTAFLAVDEIQLAADAERGHIFTDRLLHARGEDETMFLGAETIKPLIRRLVPRADHISRPRFSTLTYTGPKKVTRLPPRSAVVAFSAAEVYELAELVRRQRGGTAVVMGVLSPRTRNAQVEMYQSGEVDYLVATDAIGMGLNMDVDHVAFARLSKFDGRVSRRLSATEIAQIAGRAGRHMTDGSFGTTAEVGALEPELVEAVENHRFPALATLNWRNPDLDFRSPALLLRSLEEKPVEHGLVRAREADDQRALALLVQDEEIARRAVGPAAGRLLWDVCQVPDFRKVMSDAHTRLLRQIFLHLAAVSAHHGQGRLPEDWVADQVTRIDNPVGDIDSLTVRIAHIRTWTYIANRPDWLADPARWQERAREVEDRLSDALHQSLTQRFVDKRHAVLVRRMKDGGPLLGAVTTAGEVVVEGHAVGQLDGFRFTPDPAAGDPEALRSLMSTARRVLAQELPPRLRRFETEPDEAFALAPDGVIAWRGTPVARLAAGDTPLSPRVEPLAAELLEGPARERVRRRLVQWLEGFLRRRLRPLWRARETPLAGAARGLLFQLVEALGVLPRRALQAQLNLIGKEERAALSRLGVRLGAESLWFPALQRQAAASLLGQLCAIHRELLPAPHPARDALWLARDLALPDEWYAAVGYRLIGSGAVRVDALERLSHAARIAARDGSFAAETLGVALPCDRDELRIILKTLGYRAQALDGAVRFAARPRSRAATRQRARARSDQAAASAAAAGEGSPFAALRRLRFGE